MAIKTELCAHRRVEYPQPSGETWKIGCACGWLGGLPQWTENLKEELDRQFVEHVPADQRRVYVRVDQRQRPDPRDEEGERTVAHGNWIMPEGVPCVIGSWYGDNQNGFFVNIVRPIEATFPVGEVFTADGQIFRFEDGED